MSVTDEIKARLDIVDFIGQKVPLKKSGRNYKALCPFHEEKTPSFVVFPDSQQWRCFGACGEGGDIFTFVMKHEGWDFPGALRYLAEQAGVDLQPPTPEQAEQQEQHDRLRGLLEEAAQFFHRQLHHAPNARHAREYVARRGLAEGTVADFLVGYAPNSWDATMNTLLEKGYSRDDLVEAGMVVVREDGGVYDRFRDRLVIPIRDPRGRVVGFGARALAADATPKYLNSPQTPVFDKSRLLYGFSQARRAIREWETAVIVEGYMDVMQAHQAGFANVVAEMGTALTEQQLRLLARYAGRLILALDPDTAGQMATERGREVIERVSKTAAAEAVEDGVWDLDTAEREYRAKVTTEFDARGMLRYESRLGFDIRVIVLPEGWDPDDLIREDPDAWDRLVENAQPIVDYVIDRTVEGQNLNDAKVKSWVAAQVTPLIDDVADPVERSHYRQRIARLLKVPEAALFAQSAPPPRRARPPEPPPNFPPDGDGEPPGPPPIESPTHLREAFCLAGLIRYPRLLYRVNRVFAEFLAPERMADALPDEGEADERPGFETLAWYVTPGDFAHPAHQAVFQAWLDALNQDEHDPAALLRESLDAATRALVEDWFDAPLYALKRGISPPDVELSDDRVFEEVILALLQLRAKRLDETFQEITFLMEDEDGGGDSLTVQQYHVILDPLLVARERVNKALKRYGPAHRDLGDGGQARLQRLAS
jgi:DNA primase